MTNIKAVLSNVEMILLLNQGEVTALLELIITSDIGVIF